MKLTGVLINFVLYSGFWENGFVGILKACVELLLIFYIVGFGFSLYFVGFGLLNL